MSSKKSRRIRDWENLPILLELIRFQDPEKISTTEVAKKFGVPQQRVAALLSGLRKGSNSWARVAQFYNLPESMRPPWIGAGTAVSTPHPRPPTTSPVAWVGQQSVRTLTRTLDYQAAQATYTQSPPAKPRRSVVLINDEPMIQLEWPDGHTTLDHLTVDELTDYQIQEARRRVDEELYRKIEQDRRMFESLSRPPTPEEEKRTKEEQEKLQRENREWVENMTLAMTFIKARDNQKALKHRREMDELPKQFQEARNSIPRQSPGPSQNEQVLGTIKAVTTILHPVMLPFDELKELQRIMEENRKSDRRATLAIAKEIIDSRKEQWLKRQRERDAYWEKNNMSYEEFERRFPWKPRHLRHH